MDSLSTKQARRMFLAAQGFTDPMPVGEPTGRHLKRVVARTGLIQMDSITVLQRAHYLPVYSRIGPYDPGLLDRAAYASPRFLFEYWGHAASLIPVSLQPHLRWRMAQAHEKAWGGMRRVVEEQPHLVAWVQDEVRARGPITAGELESEVQAGKASDEEGWGWNWTAVKSVLEYLFWAGEVLAAGRNSAWARLYAVPEKVLPKAVLEAPTPTDREAFAELVRISARAFGVANEAELRDYFRLPVEDCRQAVRDLVDVGELLPVSVQGWRGPAYLHPQAKIPRKVEAATLLSPFDPLVWERSRTERLFDFEYRIGIYTPAEKRIHGYYSLPFLLGEFIVARVDLKADRKSGTLLVPGAWAERGHDPGEIAEALAVELRRMAGWLGLAKVGVPVDGDLARPLKQALTPMRARSNVGA